MVKQAFKTTAALTGLVTGVVAVVLAPAAFAVSSTANTNVNVAIGNTISITSSGTVNLSITPTSSGESSSASDTVSVSTNDAAGYTLQLASSTSQVTLKNGSNTIAASAGTQAAPVSLADNTWGYRVDNVGGFGTGPTSAQTNVATLTGSWAGIPATGSPNTLKTTSATASGDTTTVWYGAKADTTLPGGTYSDTVTYTATAN